MVFTVPLRLIQLQIAMVKVRKIRTIKFLFAEIYLKRHLYNNVGVVPFILLLFLRVLFTVLIVSMLIDD